MKKMGIVRSVEQTGEHIEDMVPIESTGDISDEQPGDMISFEQTGDMISF
jgi:hypothetical protein